MGILKLFGAVAILSFGTVTISSDQGSSSSSKTLASINSSIAVLDVAKIFATSTYVQTKASLFQTRLESAQAVAAKKNKAFQEKWEKEIKKLKSLQGDLKEADFKKKQDALNKKYQEEAKKLQKENHESETRIKNTYQSIMMGIQKHIKSIIGLLVEKHNQSSRHIHVVLSTEERVLWYYDTSAVVDLTDEIIERLDQIPIEETAEKKKDS